MQADMSHVWTEPDWEWLDKIALEHNWVRFISALDRELWMTKTLEEREAAFRQASLLRGLGKNR